MKILYAITILLLHSIAFSQDDEIPDIGFPNKLPNSPEAASLGKFGDIPVGLFTGTPNINIPLYEIGLNNFKLPIFLNYNSNGIKVDQIASNVGLGWSLNTGGIITRSLNDNADEYDIDLQTGRRSTILPDTPYGSDEMTEFLRQINNNPNEWDTEPDIFYYRFNGISGKFYLDEDIEPALIEPSDIKVEKLNAFGMIGSEDYSFKITTSNGIVYWFGGQYAVESSWLRTFGNGIHSEPTIDVQNAWFLKKVTFPDKNDSIIFDYSVYPYTYVSNVSQNVRALKKTTTGVNGGHPTYNAAYHTQPVFTKVFSLSSQISAIHWASGSIEFIYSQRYNGINIFKKIDTINVRNNTGQIIKRFSFDYLEANCDMVFENPEPTGLSIDHTINKRLFLTSLQEVTVNENAPNPYLFEYYFPNELPPRLSYAQDYWGFFNGKDNPDLVPDDLSLFEEGWYSTTSIGYDTVKWMFRTVGGNRYADAEYGLKGLLKKITYPTNGFNSFEYEANTVPALEHQPPSPVDIELTVETGIEGFGITEDTFVTEVVPFDQDFIPLVVHVDTAACWTINDPPHMIKMKVIIKDLTIDSDVILFSYNPASGLYIADTTPLTILRDDDKDYYINYKKDHVYKFTIRIIRPCLFGHLKTSYINEYGEDVSVNKEVGGMRIKRIKVNDSFGIENIKRYYYSYWDNMDSSSGNLEPIKPAISFFTKSQKYFNNENELIESEYVTINMGSSSLYSVSNFQGNHINYESVIEGFGENFNNGVIEHKYNLEFDILPICLYDPILGTPNSNYSFTNGNEKETNIYQNISGSLLISSKTLNYFKEDDTLRKSLTGFNTSFYAVMIGTIGQLWLSNLSLYNINTQWHYLYKSDNFQYDKNGLNPFLKQTRHYYDNPTHTNITRIQTTNSKGETIKTTTSYPDDFQNYPGNVFMTQAAIDSMLLWHMTGIPIKTEKFVDGIGTDGQITSYRLENNETIVVPSKIRNLEGANYNPKATYDKYDNHGNPIEFHKEDNIYTTYLWGYNYSYPIAKIENAKFDEDVKPLLGCTYEELQEKTTDAELLPIFDKLRTDLPNAFVSTYTYNPLVGITSLTTPDGRTLKYDYDDFNRLETIRDQDGNVLKHIDYHYYEE